MKRLLWLFSTKGRIGRGTYALAAAAALLSQHLIAILTLAASGRRLIFDQSFLVAPVRSLVHISWSGSMNGLPALVGLFSLILSAWALAALTLRRARDAGATEPGLAVVLSLVPMVQLLALVVFGLLPSRASAAEDAGEPGLATFQWPAAIQAAFIGVALTLLAVTVGVLLFRTYGFALFLISPFVIGATTGFIANRRGDVGGGRTFALVCAALAMGGLALVATALEGMVCIVMAAPLAVGVAAIGGLIGRDIGLANQPRTLNSLSPFALLPLLLAGEHFVLHTTRFEAVESVEVAAPAPTVWQALVEMGPIPEAPAFPFGLGLAYPIDGQIQGEGVGALRKGVFSTGVAYERITSWEPGRRLSFVVLNDPPMMREMSPYAQVHAPHVNGYFRTKDAEFILEPLAGGHTRLTLRTHHELDLEPAAYWSPIARMAIHANKVRVLNHFRRRAEAAT